MILGALIRKDKCTPVDRRLPSFSQAAVASSRTPFLLFSRFDITVDFHHIMDPVKPNASPLVNLTKLRMILGALMSALLSDRRLPSFTIPGKRVAFSVDSTSFSFILFPNHQSRQATRTPRQFYQNFRMILGVLWFQQDWMSDKAHFSVDRRVSFQ